MKFIISALVLSTFLVTQASADAEPEHKKVNELGYPWSAPADTWDSGDLSTEALSGTENAKEILKHVQITAKDKNAIAEFLKNPMMYEYILRETKTWDNLSGPVIKAYVTVVSILNEETGENFKAVFVPDSPKALEILSLQKDLLPEEAEIIYLKNPKMETGEYFTEDQKVEALKYIQDNFKISQQAVDQYINAMGDFDTN